MVSDSEYRVWAEFPGRCIDSLEPLGLVLHCRVSFLYYHKSIPNYCPWRRSRGSWCPCFACSSKDPLTLEFLEHSWFHPLLPHQRHRWFSICCRQSHSSRHSILWIWMRSSWGLEDRQPSLSYVFWTGIFLISTTFRYFSIKTWVI